MPASLDVLTGSQTAPGGVPEDRPGPRRGGRGRIGAGRPNSQVDVARWVAGLSGPERDALLVGLLEGDDPLLRAATLRRRGRVGR